MRLHQKLYLYLKINLYLYSVCYQILLLLLMSSENARRLKVFDISHYFIAKKISFLMHQEDDVLIFPPTVLWFIYLFMG